ncbi:MAG TPA: hypothetical protein VNS08_17260 [Ureibacillus sp.]|nr:hypothetical protein [Ureibacillus sp.]
MEELEGLEIEEDGSYDFSKLSSDFKKYMRLKDDEFFNKAYSEWKNSKQYEEYRQQREIDKVEERYDRGIFEDELITILSGQKIKYETPTYIKARTSSRRAYKTVIELIRANLNVFESFITLTFARKEHEAKYLENGSVFDLIEDTKDFEECKKVFSKFINTVSKNMRRKGKQFEYVAVYEQHKDGSYHFHMISTKIDEEYLIACPEWLDIDYKTKKKRNGKMMKHWSYGKSDVEEIRDKEKMSTYLCKYLIKSFNSLADTEESYLEYLGKRKYFPSKGLKRPEVEYIKMNDIAVIESIEKKKAEYSSQYSTTYKNPYSDSEITRTLCSKVLN